MDKRKIPLRYKELSPEDQRTFNRWLVVNTAVGLILAAGLLTMAVVGSTSPPHSSTAVGGDRTGREIITGQIRR
jgi:hypothetical protein